MEIFFFYVKVKVKVKAKVSSMEIFFYIKVKVKVKVKVSSMEGNLFFYVRQSVNQHMEVVEKLYLDFSSMPQVRNLGGINLSRIKLFSLRKRMLLSQTTIEILSSSSRN